jgi:hypothetical protein
MLKMADFQPSMKATSLLLFIVLSCGLVQFNGCKNSNPVNNNAYYLSTVVVGKDKMAMIQTDGKMAFPAFARQAQLTFYEGLARFQVGNAFGFINSKGNLKIPAKYKKALFFSDGLAAVMPDSTWGFIDSSGKMVVSPQYAEIRPFCDGLAAVKKNGLWGFIDTKGETIIPFQFQNALTFGDGLVAVQAQMNRNTADSTSSPLWGFVDKSGQWVIQPQYAIIFTERFSDGYCMVLKGDTVQIIQPDGEIALNNYPVLNPQFFKPFRVINDFIPVMGKSADGSLKWGIQSIDGKLVVGYKFDDISNLGFQSSNLFLVSQHGKYGYINAKGEYVIKPQFSKALDFQGTLALAFSEDRAGFIDTKGNWVIQPQFDAAASFQDVQQSYCQ